MVSKTYNDFLRFRNEKELEEALQIPFRALRKQFPN